MRHRTSAVLEHYPVQRPARRPEQCQDYEQFRQLLMTCLTRCYDALEPGGRLAVLIGDVRRKGKYTAIVKDVLNFPHGEITQRHRQGPAQLHVG
jgi:hypothetical protein